MRATRHPAHAAAGKVPEGDRIANTAIGVRDHDRVPHPKLIRIIYGLDLARAAPGEIHRDVEAADPGSRTGTTERNVTLQRSAPKALADVMQRLLEDPPLAGALVAQAHGLIQGRFAPEKRTQRLAEVYREIAN